MRTIHLIFLTNLIFRRTVFLRDLLDNLSNCEEELREVIRDCANIDVEAEKYQQRQMDATLYTLTVISAVFLPAQFLTGYVALVVWQESVFLLLSHPILSLLALPSVSGGEFCLFCL